MFNNNFILSMGKGYLYFNIIEYVHRHFVFDDSNINFINV